jgi:hypothetical protein
MISSDELQIASLVSFSPRPGLFGSTMQGSLPAVHPQGRFAATPIDGAMAWLTAHWPVPAGVLLGQRMLLGLQFSTADIKRLVSTNALAMLGLPKPGNRSSNG